MIGVSRWCVGAVLSIPLVAAVGACASDSEELITPHGGGGTGGASSSSSSSSTTSSGQGGSSVIGLACTEDVDCYGTGVAGRCAKPSDEEPFLSSFYQGGHVIGGPGNGYCTKECTTDEECPADSSCRSEICVRNCEFGTPEGGPYDDLPDDKCHGRDDLICVPIQGGAALCIPMCGSDADCGDGRGCDVRAGVCVDTPRQGLALGAGPCEVDDDDTPDDEDPCRGFCLPFEADQNQEVHLCSALCSWGGDLDTSHNCGGPTQGLCAYQSRTLIGDTEVVSQLGDAAFCTGSCADHGACNFAEGFFCFDVGLLGTLGVGYCFGAVPCPGGGGDCDADEACTETASGPMCLEIDDQAELTLPLGNAAPGSGAGGGGGAGGSGGAGGGSSSSSSSSSG
ncbi:MAG: hypothetical protein JRI68_04955 [Deltaproteobacteria bacterium]|nr:hypothetical protein [Deltaproteobacteria bacterium]